MRAAACCLLRRLGSPWPSGPWAAGAAHIRLPRTSAATVRSRYGPSNRRTQQVSGRHASRRAIWRVWRSEGLETATLSSLRAARLRVLRSFAVAGPPLTLPPFALPPLTLHSPHRPLQATMAEQQRQWSLQRDWVGSGSSLDLPTEVERFLVLDADNMAPEGSAFRPLAQAHCRGTSIALKPLPRRPDKRPGIAVMVCQEGGVRIGLEGANGEALRCRTEWVAKVSTGMDMTQRGSRAACAHAQRLKPMLN